MATRTTGSTRTPAQVFALVFGVVYLLVGLVGFAVTGFDEFAGETYNEKLLVFPLNPLHNLVHIAIGGLWLYGAKDHPTAKSVNVVIGVAYLGVFVLGLLGVLKFLAIEDAGSADNYLHLASGLLAVYFGTAGAAGPATSRTAG
jgi:RsiW-degrading membrane proteinase PrsW (M82 family)